jgi:SAM-dependent methyltransferase
MSWQRVNDAETVRREYAREDTFLARRLTTWAELIGPLVEDVALSIAAECAAARVLDAGCGTGDFTERLHHAAARVTALDLSPRMAALASSRGLDSFVADIAALPFLTGTYDCVVANRVLYHLPDLDRGVAEIARVLSPGGALVAITYSRDHLDGLWRLVGPSPAQSTPFSAENGAAVLGRHFAHVERRDVTGVARFHSREAILGLLATFGSFTDVDLGARLGNVPLPFDDTYRHGVFIARNGA